MKPNNDRGLTLKRLKEFLDYNPDTGNFVWIKKRKGVTVGNIAGSKNNRGYIHLVIDQNLYLAHRLAWFYMTGEWPENQIDHINGIKDDNRFKNLRDTTCAQNSRNRSAIGNRKYKGVHFCKNTKKWRVRIEAGTYETEDEAAQVYNNITQYLWGDYCYLNEIKDEN